MRVRRPLLGLLCATVIAVGVVLMWAGSGEASSKVLTAGPVSMPMQGQFVARIYNPTTKSIDVRLNLRNAIGGIGNSAQTVTVPPGSTRTATVACGVNVGCTGVPVVESTKVIVSGAFDSVDTGGKVAVPFGAFVAVSA